MNKKEEIYNILKTAKTFDDNNITVNKKDYRTFTNQFMMIADATGDELPALDKPNKKDIGMGKLLKEVISDLDNIKFTKLGLSWPTINSSVYIKYNKKDFGVYSSEYLNRCFRYLNNKAEIGVYLGRKYPMLVVKGKDALGIIATRVLSKDSGKDSEELPKEHLDIS